MNTHLQRNEDGTYTIAAKSTSKHYTGSKTVKADGKAENEKPNAPMISNVKSCLEIKQQQSFW